MTGRRDSSLIGRLWCKNLLFDKPASSKSVLEPKFEVLIKWSSQKPLDTTVSKLDWINGQKRNKEEKSKGNMGGRDKLWSINQKQVGTDSRQKKLECHLHKEKVKHCISIKEAFSLTSESKLEKEEQTKHLTCPKNKQFFLHSVFFLKHIVKQNVKTKWNTVLPWFPLLLIILCFRPSFSQGHFPQMENIAAFKPVSIFPVHSTCGFPERSSYCLSATSHTGLQSCHQGFCAQDCPYRSSTPPYAPLLLPAHRGSCVTEDDNDTPTLEFDGGFTPTSLEDGSSGSNSMIFWSVLEGCFVSPPSQKLGSLGSLTLAVWVKPNTTGEMMLLEMSSEESLALAVTISEQAVILRYGAGSVQTPLMVSFSTRGRLAPLKWTYLVLQIHERRVSLFLDGLEEDGTPFETQTLSNRIHDTSEGGAMRVGLSSNGSNQFIGHMQDFRFYPATLTNREIAELYSGILPYLHTQSECRCPPRHPRVHPLLERYCIPNGVEDTINDRAVRLSEKAHPLSYLNDNDMGTTWISKTMNTQEMDDGVTISVNLLNGQFQVFYVIIQFGGLLPETIVFQRRYFDVKKPHTEEQPWSDWQYIARNCSEFQMDNNGPLLESDSVNCLKLPSEVPYTGGNVTFSLLTSEPNLRPGYNDFYNTPALQKMVYATQVRIHLSGQYLTTETGVNPGHRYYAVKEITISGRCDCHGHADHCDSGVKPYRCSCLPESHTEGNNCQRCAPLFNDKPFRSGNQLQPMNCRPCQCYGHAFSCHYDARVDDHVDDHYRGGGGVCDNCMHNTSGRNCELCASEYFRIEGSDPSSADVCQPCNCDISGTVNGSVNCIQVGGQCLCKTAVTGRRCTDCLPGWFGLDTSNPNGCVQCNCSDLGTRSLSTDGVLSCNQHTGQCPCKPYVTGLSCDRCEFGYWNLSHPNGCVPCECDPSGSLSLFCEPEGGQCECRPGVGGRRCDSCGKGSFALSLQGSCSPCNCSEKGTVLGTVCDPHTGQCVCKKNVYGRQCDTCQPGYHTLDHRNSFGCLSCVCDLSGTLPGTTCDIHTGQCPCKQGVEGAQCNNCALNYYNQTTSTNDGWFHSCVPCSCDPNGIVGESVCDTYTGQCVCLSMRYGKDCSRCRLGFYLSLNSSLCVECGCHPTGAVQNTCESPSGQCECSHPSVGGRRCDQCGNMFFGFNPGLGRCQPCTCDPLGSLNGTCHPESGVCFCKPFVTGDRCDVCQPGSSYLDKENHYGCSKAPSQQPAPVASSVNYSAILLTWRTPDSPNSNKLNYTLVRDGQFLHTIQRHHPFNNESIEDTDLSPFTNYTYWLITANVAGSTISAPVSCQTLGAPPLADELKVKLVGRPGPTSAHFTWSTPPNDRGPVERFVLLSIEGTVGDPVIQYTGQSTEAVANDLKPFTQYTVTLEACASGGCTSSKPLSLLTASAPPQNQPPPNVTAVGPGTLYASWDPPVQPNGVITKYEVFLLGPIESYNLSRQNTGKLVFTSTGWLDRGMSYLAEQTNSSTIPPPESSTMITGLQAFSTYQIRVVSSNKAGSVISQWTMTRTTEGVPEFIAPPEVTPLSASSLKVSWNSTEGHGVIPRGQVTEYRVNLVTEQYNNPHAPPIINQVLHRASPSSQPTYLVKGLKPYRVYTFSVTLCTKASCITSSPTSGRTLSAAPTGLSPPQLYAVNESAIQIRWDPPAQLNGPPPLYQVERIDVSLSDPKTPVVRGTRFPGNSFYEFPNDTVPAVTDFTGIRLSFKTHSPNGLLLAAFSPGAQEEFIAIELKHGQPHFIFDPQGSPVTVSVNNGGLLYNDNQWHSIKVTRKGSIGTITLDGRYTGTASASNGNSIIGENTGVFIGGLPENFTIHRKDLGLVQMGFTGCLRDVQFLMTDSPSEQWKSLNWASAIKKVSAYESWEGCPAQLEDGAHFLGHGHLELSGNVFRGGKKFKISLEFRTDQLNALLLFTYNTQTDDYMLVELEGGLLSFIVSCEGEVTSLSMWAGLSYCDGDWKQLSVTKKGSLISAVVGDWEEATHGGEENVQLKVDSPLYLGGVPSKLSHPALISKSHKHGLGGCIRSVSISDDKNFDQPSSQFVNLFVVSLSSVRVFLGGCPISESRYNCRGNDSVLIYTGKKTQIIDHTLQPFTEYLYRYVALGAGGWSVGPWQRGRSQGKGTQVVPPPRALQSLNGFSVNVFWTPSSDELIGMIDYYELKAYNQDSPKEAPITATYLANGNFTGILSGLTPATRYSVTVTACTHFDCTESLQKDTDGRLTSLLTTPEEAPDAVFSPVTVSSPTSAHVTWKPPAQPNGVITEYLLYHNGQMVYKGTGSKYNITGKQRCAP